MQKHERLALRAIEEVLVGSGLSISRKFGRAKMRIMVEGRGIRETKTVSSSPGSERSEIDHARQWATRVRRRLAHG